MPGQSPESHLLLQEKSCKEKYFAHADEFPAPFSMAGTHICLCETGSFSNCRWPDVTGRNLYVRIASLHKLQRRKNLRRFGWVCLVMLVGLCSAVAFLRFSVSVVSAASHSVTQAKLLKTSAKADLSVPAVSVPAPISVPAGDILYSAKRGEAVVTVARRYLGQTSYLTSSELSDAIRKANGDYQGTFFKANQQVLIPGILPAPIVEKMIPVQRDFEARAVYLTAIMAASDHGIRIVKQWRAVGGNAVVFDIKDSDGSVNIPFDYPLLGQHHVVIHDLPKYIHFLHSQNMHAIARVAIFRDQHLVETHPELAVKSRKTGLPWRENGKLVWTDSSNPKVQDYDI